MIDRNIPDAPPRALAGAAPVGTGPGGSGRRPVPSPRGAIPVLLVLAAVLPSAAGARGLYLDLPGWFQRPDTSGTAIGISQSWIEADDYDASVTGLSVPFNMDERTSVVLKMAYPLIHRAGGFKHGFADGSIGVSRRIWGDSLNVSGLFLRADIRIPIGSNSLRPFSFRSRDGGLYPDVGAGLEYRRETPFAAFRSSATWTFSGQRDDSPIPYVTDFLVIAASVEIPAGEGTSIQAAVFGIDFEGPGYRESYLLALRRFISERLLLVVTGALDAGKDRDRVFDSLLSVSFRYDLPGRGD